MRRSIAIVEDEAAIRQNYAAALSRQGYQVRIYANRAEAEAGFAQHLPDLVLLDIGLDDEIEGGFELCLGADDYLTKDISLVNLCARIGAFFRRLDVLRQPQAPEQELRRGDLLLDMDRYSASWRGRPIDLSLTEFWIVYNLANHPGHVKSREQLMQAAHVVVDDATITSHIKRIRKKFIEADKDFVAIDSVYGLGYRWQTS